MVQLFILLAAIYTGVSRIQDNKHHPSDVIAGCLIGSAAQILNILGVTRVFQEEKVTNQDNEIPLENIP